MEKLTKDQERLANSMSKVIAPYIENAYSKGFAAGMSAVKDLLEGFVKQVVKAKNEEQDLEKKNK